MCGVAGILAIAGAPPTERELTAMNGAQSHRGPDDEGIYIDGIMGLAHRRLSIFDLSKAGHQPMASADDRYILTYNGEIYNWPEIRQQLRHNSWRSNTDTETLLQAFSEWGPDCLRRFNGMFAFAIWDRKQRTLFLARDRVGIKPLHLGTADGRIFFASEVKAMVAAGFPIGPNEEAVYDFLRWGLTDHSDATFFKGVEHVKPAHWIRINADGSREEHCYWDLPAIVRDSRSIDRSEAIEAYGGGLKETIRLYTRSDVPVGAFLSSGLDSSILISFMAEQGLQKLCSFTYDFDTGDAGERGPASDLARTLAVDHDSAVLHHADVPSVFEKVLYHQEAPFTSMRVLAQYKLYELAKARGYTVILDGNGGDQTGGGFEYYWLSAVMDAFVSDGFEKGAALFHAFMDKYQVPKDGRIERLLGTLAGTLTPGVCTQDGVPFVRPEHFSEGFRHRHRDRIPRHYRPFQEHLLNAQFIDLTAHNQPRVLRYSDRCSMAFSREQRVPILDHNLIELGFRSAPDARVFGTEQRYYMREAARKYLPPEVAQRPKRSIVDPQRQWLKSELREWVGDLIHSAGFAALDVFDVEAVQEEYRHYCSIDGIPPSGFHVFQWATVGHWYLKVANGGLLQHKGFAV